MKDVWSDLLSVSLRSLFNSEEKMPCKSSMNATPLSWCNCHHCQNWSRFNSTSWGPLMSYTFPGVQFESGQLLHAYLDTWPTPSVHIPLFCSSHKKDKFRDEIINNSRWQQQSIVSSKIPYWKETLYNAQVSCPVSWLHQLVHQNKVYMLLNCP